MREDFAGFVQGGFAGLAAVAPVVVDVMTLRCPPGMVLGKFDELCYMKGKNGITNAQRKWPAPPRPFLTGGDKKVLARADAIRNSKTTKRLLKQYGLGG